MGDESRDVDDHDDAEVERERRSVVVTLVEIARFAAALRSFGASAFAANVSELAFDDAIWSAVVVDNANASCLRFAP